MDVPNGDGVDSAASESIDTACAPCSAMFRGNGVESDLIGTCGARIISTVPHVGSGDVSAEWDGTCTACELRSVGLALDGSMCGVTGTCTVATASTTVCMVRNAGPGVDTGALVCTCTAIERFGVITRVSGKESEHIGISGSATTISVQIGGSGARVVVSTVTGTGFEFSCGGLVPTGSKFEVIGASTAKTITTTSSTAGKGGSGEDIDVLVCTVTAYVF